ncbi:MAG: outer membrane beta-barrel family protein [Prevotellaceae bacterium]|jgi:hypothetical protein|nr:outer membrane beta-barrel family protein [Prevotellaceae bacterium]
MMLLEVVEFNIKTKKSFANGLNGNARLGYKQFFEDDFYCRGNGSIALNYRGDKISAYVNYGAWAGSGFNQLKEKMFIRDTLRRNTEMNSDDDFISHSAKFGLDYFLNRKNTIGAIANFSYRKSEDDGITNTTVFDGGPVSLDSSRTESANGRTFASGSLNLNHTYNFDKEQQELTTNLDYRRYTSKPWQNQNTQFFKSNSYPEIFKNNTNQTIDIYGVKVDYVHPISDRMRLEGGGKIEQTNTDNRVVRWDSDGTIGRDTLNLNESNDFKYYERISALYANYSWSIDSMWSVKAGLRYENTWSKGDWITEGTVTKKKYNDLFPTLFIGFNPSQNHNFGLSYTRRINRPGYWNLNPFRRYIDPYTYFQGNPNLDPAYGHRVNLEYNLFRFINLSLGYSHTKGMMIQIPESLPNNMTAYRQGNFGKTQNISFNIHLSQVPVAKWWSMNVSIWMAYIMNENYSYSNSNFGGNIWTNNTFTLSKTVKAELEFWANTPMVWGYFETKFQGSLNLGVKKSFWNNIGSLSIYFDDILGTNKFNATTRIDGIQREVENLWESCAIRFAFTYRFGQANQSAIRRNVGQQDDADRVGGGGDK